ncbi:YcaO-like family protein [Eubacterium multiforme]|uniref:Ribosomal protein S12 methylthiotransferase accessory factor n=1 Tax=Eubacterium multiforme TaxID=83339 RepID=A0ABT9UTL8_9FIRM|nr:YcaO-like family protein [Eubacterium multiforme]MDQ0149645.1 ribosomal protein S12 methylthiotransferase accessory factor [Eubacterium multiforme]
MGLYEQHFKEITPDKTIEKLLGILSDINIELEEHWEKESSIGTYSLRLTFKGTDIGTNGKGVNKEYARASAYAEFFERYQNNMLTNFYIKLQDDDSNQEEVNICIEPDSKYLTAEEIINQEDPFIEYYFSIRGMENSTYNDKVKNFKNINKFEYMLTGKENKFLCLPFYDCYNDKIYYLPKHIYFNFYGSNGMAAGNTVAEALVQGFSEIIERIAQKRIFNERPTLPDIPIKYLKEYPNIYDMFLKINELKGYRAIIKDCSFGGKYPAAALVVINKNTGKYGVKLGCHPNYGIAMERAFTESAQGNDITEYANRSELDFYNTIVDNEKNIENSFKTGLAQYPYELFGKNCSYKFTPMNNFEDIDNKSLLKSIIYEIKKEGYHVLIRNSSNLGFPSFHIIIPGLSELRLGTDSELRAMNTRAFVTSLLMEPRLINKKNCKYIIACFGYFANNTMNNTLKSYYPEVENLELPSEKYYSGILYFSAMCYVLLEEYNEAYKNIRLTLQNAIKFGAEPNERIKLDIMSKYLAAMDQIKDHNKVINYLKNWYDNDWCQYIDRLFSNKTELFISQYPDCTNWRENENFKSERVMLEALKELRRRQINNYIKQSDVKELIFS